MILGYIRVSTSEQATDDKTSIENQESIIRQYAAMQGISKFDLQMYTDAGVSGSTPMKDRPAGAKLLEEAAKGDTVVAAKMDRIFRSSIDALQTVEGLKERGINLVLFDMGMQSVMQDGPAKLFFSMLAAFAEFERGRIKERITTGKVLKKKKGGHIGGRPPYGTHVVGNGSQAKLEPDETELRVIDLVRKDFSKNPESFDHQAACQKLNKAGFKARSGAPFRPYQIKRIADQLRLQ